MKNDADYPVFFKIRRSTIMMQLILVMHFISVAACLLNGLSIQYQLILILWVAVSLIIHLIVYNQHRAMVLKYSKGGGWELTFDKQAYQSIDISATSVLTSLVTVLYFKQGDANKTLVVFKDALSLKEYRILRVILKMTGLNIGKNGENRARIFSLHKQD